MSGKHVSKKTRNQEAPSFSDGWKERLRSGAFWLWLLIGLLFLIPLAVFPIYAVYLKNIKALTFFSILQPALRAALLYIAVYAVAALVSGRPSMAALLTALVMAFLMNFGTISTALGALVGERGRNGAALALTAVAIVGLGYLILRHRKNSLLQNLLVAMLAVMMNLLLVINTAGSWSGIRADIAKAKAPVETPAPIEETEDPEAAARAAEEAARAAEEAARAAEEAERQEAIDLLFSETLSDELPNIYFFLIDEFAGFDEMEKYYGFDSTEFKAFLDANHVNYSGSSHSMYNHTAYCMSDICSYTQFGQQLVSGDRSLSQYTKLNQALTGIGYRLYNMSVSKYIFQGVPPLMSNLAYLLDSRTEDGLTAEDIAKENSIMQMFLGGRSDYESRSGETMSVEEILASEEYSKLHAYYQMVVRNNLTAYEYFENPENYVLPHSGIGYFCYMLTTHVPLIFHEDGSVITTQDDYRNWQNPDIYLGCYGFALRHAEKVIETILDNDPYSVIIIQGDHGVRYHQETTMRQDFTIEEEDTRNMMNLVYFEGKPLDIEGLSATDTIRVVLRMLGVEQDYNGDPLELEGDRTMLDVIGEEQMAELLAKTGEPEEKAG